MKELGPKEKQALLAPFQSAEVRVRTIPYIAAYVTARVVMTRLDEVLPWQWSFKLIGSGVIDSNGVMHQDGALIIRHPDGSISEFHERGSAPPDPPKAPAKQAKHAVSDCFKRCAIHAGVGRYLYELIGAQSGRIPKSSLEKALAAVGYNGPWDERHYGAIGGVREADMEDDDVTVSPPATEPARSSPSPASAANANGSPGVGIIDPHKKAIDDCYESMKMLGFKRDTLSIRCAEEELPYTRESMPLLARKLKAKVDNLHVRES